MKLTIKHISKYKFSKNLSYGVQRLRLKPQNNKIQNINRWNINIQGGVEQFEYLDHHQNLCTFLTLNNDLKEIIISVDGQINTIESMEYSEMISLKLNLGCIKCILQLLNLVTI